MDRSEPKAPEVVQPSVSRPIQEGPRATFAAVKPPSLALPPAGGAMRSIGETFQVSPATGTASASLPLPLTPAPRGPMPAVSLGYDSGSGNGLCGHGWALSVPQIVRRSDHRLPTYLDSQDADELLFAGEVLVPHFEGATRDERDVTEGAVSYRVERYRPRIEAAFTLLERWRAPDGSVHFRAHAADNSRSTFGTTAASRIADPRDERRVYAWLLDETRDDRGHVVSYHYVAEDLGGVPTGLASERARREGRLRFANKHLKRIRYANATPHDASSYRLELVLDYGDHDPEVPSETPSGPWLARQDPSSTHRPGFDLRSYRLLRRALMFHRFSELGDHRLVRSLDLGYAESPKLTQLVSATIVGYSWAGTTYARQELPSVTLGYTAAVLQRAIATIPRQELRDLEPTQLNKTAQWVDLDGEGLPGVLTQRRGAHHYKPNRGGAQLGPGRLLDSAPNLPAGGAQLMDLDGGGDLAMVRLDPRGGGYQERTRSGWGPFRTFAANPGVDFGSPHLKMVDLNGDGADDLLLSRGDHLVWYPSLGKQGWGAAQRIPLPDDPKRGPALIFGGVHSSVFLADMTGDGLQDLVRIGHSQVVYWPNQGHGRFGAQIVMDACPRLERPDRFHPTRVRLADLDGTGTADLLYFHARGVSIYLNQAGNRWSEELRNESIPVPSALPSLAITDLHGTGMATLTWAGSPQCHPGTLRHTTPFGTAKPYLLATIDNGMGLTRTLSYGSSTAHYLRDQRAGRPWPTKLPFPVQVLDRVDTRDAIAGTRLVTRYRYSHGYYDPQDRELRGFGLVETEDAETFAPGEGAGSFPELPHDDAGDLAQPPVLTKTWFHTGAFPGAKPLQDHYDSEAWRGDPNAPGPLHCDLPTGLSPEELRQAHRALKGTQLRQEIYGTDDLSAPYQIREAAVTLKRLQPARPSRSPGRPLHPIYQLLPRETREHHYDRIASDPRVTQWCALAHDPAHGFVTQDLTLAYARRSAPHAAAEDDPELADLSEKLPEQTRVYALATETDLAHTTSGGYRIGVPLETRAYEITGLSGATVQTHAALLAHYESAEASTLTYHQAPSTGPQRRLIERVKLRYLDSEDLPDPLPFGEIDARALLHQAYRLDLTDALLDHHELDTLITSTVLSEAGYVTLPSEDGHWIPSGTSTLDPAAFYLPTSVSDPFGNTTTLTYDADNLLVDAIEDPLGNTLSADHDYRLLAPKLVTDINGNRTTAAYDDLGRITAIALMGQAGAGEGDTLASPTQDFEHHTTEWTIAQRANYIRVRARRTHGGTPSWQTTYLYSDGSGRIALVKTQAEPGLAPELDEDGNILLDGGDVVQSHADPRWVGSGRTLFNNKGNPVKQYEPYFSRTHTWDTDPNLHHWGITPILHYDPTGRLVRTDHPDGSYEKTTHGTWKTQTWDRNDTLDDEANRWRQARETLPHHGPQAHRLRQSQRPRRHPQRPIPRPPRPPHPQRRPPPRRRRGPIPRHPHQARPRRPPPQHHGPPRAPLPDPRLLHRRPAPAQRQHRQRHSPPPGHRPRRSLPPLGRERPALPPPIRRPPPPHPPVPQGRQRQRDPARAPLLRRRRRPHRPPGPPPPRQAHRPVRRRRPARAGPLRLQGQPARHPAPADDRLHQHARLEPHRQRGRRRRRQDHGGCRDPDRNVRRAPHLRRPQPHHLHHHPRRLPPRAPLQRGQPPRGPQRLPARRHHRDANHQRPRLQRQRPEDANRIQRRRGHRPLRHRVPLRRAHLPPEAPHHDPGVPEQHPPGPALRIRPRRQHHPHPRRRPTEPLLRRRLRCARKPLHLRRRLSTDRSHRPRARQHRQYPARP
ncbi:MAG: toxin [Polyangiaceae bacterium]|nr:toxin [Polyangiaceae bacterium]